MMKFSGIMPALLTPLREDESLNTDALKLLLESLLAQGADGFYIASATGEGIALRPEVRMELAEEAIRIVDHRKPCILHIASPVFSDAIRLAKHAEACGADGISAIPPMFFAYSQDDVYNYYKALAEAVHIPLMIYYNPNAGFRFTAEFAARVFEIDNVTAIKWTSSDYYGMMQLKTITNGEMNVINGPDEMLLMGLSAGADGGIGSTYNVMYPLIKSVYENFRKGDIAAAQAAQQKASNFIHTLLRFPLIPELKAILTARGIPMGNAAFPLTRLSPETVQEAFAALKEVGFQI